MEQTETKELENKEEIVIDQAELERIKLEAKIKEELENVLNKTIPKFDENGDEVERIPLREIIDPDKDIWFSPKKMRPILNETGFKKIAEAVNAEFSEYRIVEKQSDYRNFQNSQVWVEQKVKLPNGEINIESGVANHINCSDPISKANMPIMAVKRAKSRALFRSKTVNLPVFDESEVQSDLLSEFEKKNEEIKRLEEELMEKNNYINQLQKDLNTTDKKFKGLFNLVAKSITYDGKLIWKIDDLHLLNQWLTEVKGLEEYVVRARIRWLNNKQQNGNNN